MKSQIQTNNVNSTELWVELSEQQSSELSGGTDVNVPINIAPINILNDFVILDDADVVDQSGDSTILSGVSLGIFKRKFPGTKGLK